MAAGMPSANFKLRHYRGRPRLAPDSGPVQTARMAYPRLSIVLASGARIGPGKTRLLESIRRRSDHPDPAVRLWRSDQGGRLPSLLVSLPTVAVGLPRHVRLGALDRPVLRTVVVPMALGSVLGAAAG